MHDGRYGTTTSTSQLLTIGSFPQVSARKMATMPMPRMDATDLARHLTMWRRDASDLPSALAEAIATLVHTGLLPSGIGLPPQRPLAAALRVSRGTVAAAFGLLDERGYIATVPGSGSRVRSGRVRAVHIGDGRMFSFTSAPPALLDLSSGALPASSVSRQVLTESLDDLAPYLDTDGYFPAGLPVLRRAIADDLTRAGLPARPQEILVTAGAQQAAFLAVSSLVTSGDTAAVEEPTYRGALETLRGLGARIESIPVDEGGLDLARLSQVLAHRPALLYCQTSIHNPTGRQMPAAARQALAATVARSGVTVVEDCCSFDLTLSGRSAPTLAGLVDPDDLMMIGTASKDFWGGVRVGWIRTSPTRIAALLEIRKALGIATSVVDQLYAVRLLEHAASARRERVQSLRQYVTAAEDLIHSHLPRWSWVTPAGGACLWVDTGEDTVALAELAERRGILLAPGSGFSPRNGHRTMLRLPVWHERDVMDSALATLAALADR